MKRNLFKVLYVLALIISFICVEKTSLKAEEVFFVSNELELLDAIANAQSETTIVFQEDIILSKPVIIDGKDLFFMDDGADVYIDSRKIQDECAFEISDSHIRFQASEDAENGIVISGDYDQGGILLEDSVLDYEYGLIEESKVGIHAIRSDINFYHGIIHDNQGSGIVLTDSSHLVMFNGTISENESDEGAGVFVTNGSSMKMQGGTIEKNTAQYGGGIYIGNEKEGQSKCTVEITGGYIKENQAIDEYRDTTSEEIFGLGGGIFLDQNAELTISQQSTIENNFASFSGGGIHAHDGSKLIINGGTIQQNEVKKYKDYDDETYPEVGGGVSVYGRDVSFEMHAGTIQNNKAGENNELAYGGGLYIASNNAIIDGGTISNNQSAGYGGGVYTTSKLQVKNVVVEDNFALEHGGGIAFQEKGTAVLKASSGVAIFHNQAGNQEQRAQAYGDDLSILDGQKTIDFYLSERMLGAAKNEWYEDGGTNGTPRYHNDSRLIQGGQTISETIALINVVEDQAIELAHDNKKVTISQNKAKIGGGIASNGEIQFGEDDIDNGTIHVEGTFSKETPEEAKKEVKVQLVLGDKALDTLVLNAENEWKASFKGLPRLESFVDIPIKLQNADPDSSQFEFIQEVISDGPTERTIRITATYQAFNVIIRKTNNQGKQLAGASLVLKGEGMEDISWMTLFGEEKTITLSPGTYKLEESSSPIGYSGIDGVTFVLGKDGTLKINDEIVKEINLVNEKKQLSNVGKTAVRLSMTDDKGRLLSGAVLKLVGNDIEDVTFESEKNSDYTVELNPGVYALFEEEAPKGYEKATPIYFIVDEDGQLKQDGNVVKEINMVNVKTEQTAQRPWLLLSGLAGICIIGIIIVNIIKMKNSHKATLDN